MAGMENFHLSYCGSSSDSANRIGFITAHGYQSEVEGKSLLLKIPHTSDTALGIFLLEII